MLLYNMKTLNATIDEATESCILKIANDSKLGYNGNKSLAIRHIVREFKSHSMEEKSC